MTHLLLMAALMLMFQVVPATAISPNISVLRAAVLNNPKDPAARRALGWALLEFEHDAETAYRELIAARELEPGDLNGQKLLALASADSGRFSKAIELFSTVLTRDPDDAW